jgi:hypothetical protein
LDDAYRMNKREPIRILIGFERGFVHQSSDSEVRHQQAVELLFHEFGCLAPQHNPGTAQVGFQFVQCGLSGKGLAR